MRNHHNYKIILVHNKASVREALTISAHRVYTFESIVENAPEKEKCLVSGHELRQISSSCRLHVPAVEVLPTGKTGLSIGLPPLVSYFTFALREDGV